jgi:transposase
VLVPELRLLAVSTRRHGDDRDHHRHRSSQAHPHRCRHRRAATQARRARGRRVGSDGPRAAGLGTALAIPALGVEGSDGLGKLLAQQLLAAGETVVEVPATLAARARLLRTGHGRKTDGIDALSVAEIAAARDDLRQVVTDEDTAVLRLLADRRDALCRQRRQAINRLHRHLRDLIPGGAPTSLTAEIASAALAGCDPPQRSTPNASTSPGS